MTKEDAIKFLQQLYPNGGHCWLDEQRIEAIGMAVKALQEEPVSKVWHDANEEQPEGYRDVVVWNPTTMDGEVLTRCVEVYKGWIWAYIDDILNLSNVERTTKNWKEPVSDDLEKEIKNYFEDWYDGGAAEYGGQATKPNCYFATVEDCKNIAHHFANWQKQQDKETIELAEDHAMLAGRMQMKEEMMKNAIRGRVCVNNKSNYHSLIYGCWDMNDALKNCNEGDNVKVIVIK